MKRADLSQLAIALGDKMALVCDTDKRKFKCPMIKPKQKNKCEILTLQTLLLMVSSDGK